MKISMRYFFVDFLQNSFLQMKEFLICKGQSREKISAAKFSYAKIYLLRVKNLFPSSKGIMRK